MNALCWHILALPLPADIRPLRPKMDHSASAEWVRAELFGRKSDFFGRSFGGMDGVTVYLGTMLNAERESEGASKRRD